MQIPVLKDKRVTSKKMLLFKNKRKITKVVTPKRDKVSTTFARQNVHCDQVKHLEAERLLSYPPPPQFSPNLSPCDFFLFPKFKFHLSKIRYKSRRTLGSTMYQYMMGVPIELLRSMNNVSRSDLIV